MPRFEDQLSLRGLARREAHLRRLDTVIDGVAQQVIQRCFELLENVAVHVGGLAANLERHRLAKALGQIPHHAREAVQAIGEGAHAAHDGLVVEAVGE